ncbi:TonB-dependent receptor [Parvularcula flava]|uniref:TonB-dependent receptor n=1 Tax=Aquisalinus luteolus TaxID=1566827 RepID=A0A8J3A4T6_9PROT|nr:TonB-dependent receptor [Aquisalinus luteolus]NHK26450.1 TonB-dependent receptor [Aquisalinus luteolus]GGH92370.1 TonB-dependent receptor [Aquisalinus luteolus]
MSGYNLKLLLAGAAAIALTAPAYAQTEEAPAEEESCRDASNERCDVLVVTVQKREQGLLDIPQSVSVVGGETLERLNATNFQDYIALVPGLQLEQSTPGVGRLILRGVNTGGVASTVSTYIDETPFGSSSGLVNGAILAGDFDTFDVERIEVLRGPQGSLYGANSLSGVLKFVTAEPSTEGFMAKVRAGVESVDGGETGYSTAGVVNIPLSDNLAVRGSGFYREIPGFIDSVGNFGSDMAEDINGTTSSGARVSLLYTPSDVLSIRLSAIAQDLETEEGTTINVDSETLEPIDGDLTRGRFTDATNDVEYRVYNGTVDWDLGFGELTSSTSYSTLEQTIYSDFDTFAYGPLISSILSLPPIEINLDQETNNEKFTQEVRVASSGEGFDWLIGGYYTKEEGVIHQLVQAVEPGTATPAGIPVLADLSITSDYEEYAAFGNVTFYLSDRFDVTLGGRLSQNEQGAIQITDGLPGLFVAGFEELPEVSSDESVFTYSIAPRYEINDQVTAYARVATGYRPGGPNILPPDVPADTPRTYESDSTTNYEAGIKAELDNVTFDAAVFYIDWTDVQLLAVINDFGLNTNGGGATSKGIEFATNWTPLDGLSLSVNGAFTDTELTEDTDPLAVGGEEGDSLPFTPEVTLALNGDYQWPLSPQVTAFVGATLSYQSEMEGNYVSAPTAQAFGFGRRTLPDYETLDLRAGLLFDNYSIDVYVDNATNSEGLTNGGNPSTTAPPGISNAGVIRPRTIGATLTARF